MSKLTMEGGSPLLALVLISCASPFSPVQSDVLYVSIARFSSGSETEEGLTALVVEDLCKVK
jgi:hypothetical protein